MAAYTLGSITLGSIGSGAKEAVLDLITICRSEHELVRQEASRALWQINGEAASNIVAGGISGIPQSLIYGSILPIKSLNSRRSLRISSSCKN